MATNENYALVSPEDFPEKIILVTCPDVKFGIPSLDSDSRISIIRVDPLPKHIHTHIGKQAKIKDSLSTPMENSKLSLWIMFTNLKCFTWYVWSDALIC